MALENEFQEAQIKVKTLPNQDSDVLLRFYALFKQSTVGDAGGKKPGMLDFVGKAKYDAWETLKGISREEAMAQYVALVNERIAAA